MSLFLAAFDRSWMWDELWRWQAEHRFVRTGEGLIWDKSEPPPREGTIPRPLEPDRGLFVGVKGALLAGLGLHETRSYLFLDDLTTNPEEPARTRHAAVELLLQAAQQYAVSVSKPICAFTAVPSLYRIARRLGYIARPAGALLVFAAAALPLPRAIKKAASPVSRAGRLTVDGENVRLKDHRTHLKVPGQGVKRTDRLSKFSNGKKAKHQRLHPR